ncbi:MAG: GyrI-like domain-containing protein [Deltaproteobacteria bacterium]|nr:GyrI-like domain-containing protein [Deltaproteobacteria bacterium]
MSDETSGYEMAVKKLPELKALTVRMLTTLENVNRDIFAKFVILYDHITARGGNADDFFTLNHDVIFNPESMDVEVCISVDEPVEDGADVSMRTVLGGSFAYVIHKGPYSGISDAIAALSAKMEERGLVPCGPMRERYMNDPDEVAPEELLTEVMFPVES